MPLDATPGGPNANSYLTRAEAEVFFADGRLHHETWTAATDADKDEALIWATRTLDSMVIFAGKYNLEAVGDFTVLIYSLTSGYGRRTTTSQRLEWPRSGLIARNRLQLLDPSIVPEEIKQATAELAMQLIAGDRTLDSDIETQGLTSLSVGSISLNFKEGVTAKVVPDVVQNLIPSWWVTGFKDQPRAFAPILRY